MGILFGFAPWIVYWTLVGNVPLLVAAVVALVIAAVGLAAGRIARTSAGVLEIGSVATFLAVAALTLLASHSAVQRWVLPLSIAGILLVTVVGVLTGSSFVHEFTAAGQPQGVVDSDVFGRVTSRLNWLWIGVFGAMTVSASIPPILWTEASLTYVLSWVIPFTLLALGALATKILPDLMTAGAGDIERKTTFVAYHEATIDELYYLATEHANREVGAGQEAYAIKVGSKGTALVGDESRQSWPSTYKVRAARR
ncbi:hypothetical protein [Mycobacterium cookii]|uniref:Uncharacterized protein n=1 Tax=Mycobacterium cookii TaxID=1775 RepID=A0A7I7KUH8_9MYCO|nr:hypothetical protein [Mycobacterium cookii]MCV7331044.1 hypothetical protein [Mycobacterium cookii]BBX45002.1 hypothetical protein MCOO_10170 [Mycobacterium cookii]